MTGIFTLLLLFIPGSKAKAADVPSTWKSVSFNDGIRYSQWVINSRISDFYGNKTQRGFNTYDASGNKIGNSKGTQDFDYVPGLVAKAILEAYANYSTFDWSKPWFYSVMNYAKDNSYTKKTSEKGITLDNMNACKMYFPLMESGVLDNSAASTGANTITAVIDNLKTYNTQYVIGGSESGVASSTNETVKSMFGGWFHKPAYTDQMWCDGLYMGAALLAQIINYKNSVHNITASTDKSDDWDLIAKQFTISWKQLYNNSKGLLYHAFTANPKDDASSAWTGISNTTGSEVYHSEAFWGRAIGWYFLALVDVLEQMPSGNKNRETLRGYLQNLASGLAKYQDAETGCWYQVIDEKDNNLTGNYLESSCTCLFAAAYLKAVRLELLPTGGEYNYKTIGENAFKGAVNQFMKCDTFGPTGATVQLVHNCASAGLGGDKKRSGSRDYYINGSDVGQTNTYTEGKVMGAFIMAATEYEKANPKSIRLSSDLAPSYSLTKGESIKVEASGEGSASYQWYDAKTSKDVSGATDASFAPEASGSYYCKITPASTSAKTRATSDEFITTGVTQVTVSKAVASSDIFSLSITYDKVYSLASGSDLNLTSEYATVT
ncbi:MAG: glycoside hydrolase family 88 protein, partial [Bacteroidales bacterium]|nr:glycoside hydrolase family 88 protein [Bacteroidales bacterium]